MDALPFTIIASFIGARELSNLFFDSLVDIKVMKLSVSSHCARPITCVTPQLLIG
jgi:hypothetical protein